MPDEPESVSSMWPQTTAIPRVANPTREEVETFICEGTPAIFEGIVPEQAQRRAEPSQLVEDGGDKEVVAYLDLPHEPWSEQANDEAQSFLSLREFADYMKASDRQLPCYAHGFPVGHFEDECLGFDKLHPDLYPHTVWIGTQDASLGMHLHRQAWVGGLWGRKRVVLIHRRYTCEGFEPVPKNPHHVRLDPRDPDFETYPDLEDVVPYVGTIEPGDVLLIPKFMWHMLWPLEKCVTAHCDFSNPIHVEGQERFDWKEFTLSLPKWFGWELTAEVLRQTVWYGALDQSPPPKKNGFEDPPYGLYIWNAIARGGQTVTNKDVLDPEKKLDPNKQ